MTSMSGDQALAFHEQLKLRNTRQRSDALAEAKAKAVIAGKEPFDLKALETMCDTSQEGRLAPEIDRRAIFEYGYYVEHSELTTLAQFAQRIARLALWN